MRCSDGKMRVEARQWGDVVRDSRYQVDTEDEHLLVRLIMVIIFSALEQRIRKRRREEEEKMSSEP